MNTKTIWEQHGFHTLTPIQEKTQELIKEGTDVVAISPNRDWKNISVCRSYFGKSKGR